MSLPTPSPAIGITPYTDESLVGFIFRLAKRVGYGTAGGMLALANARRIPTNRPELSLLEVYSALSKVPVADLEALGWGPPDRKRGIFRGRILQNAMFRGTATYSTRTICPHCLSEAAYYRAWWDIVPITACPIHNVYLINSCGRCGDDLRWTGRDIAACKCGAVLQDLQTRPLSVTEIGGSATIQGLLGDSRFEAQAVAVRCQPHLSDMTDGEIVEFLWRLGLELIGPRPKIFSVEHPGNLVLDAHIALKEALGAIHRWPDGFSEAADIMIERWGRLRTISAFRRWRDTLQQGHGQAIVDTITKKLEINAL